MPGLSCPKPGRGRPSLALVLHLVQAPGRERHLHPPLERAHPRIPQKERWSYSSRLEARAWGQPSQWSQFRLTQDRTWKGREALAQLTWNCRVLTSFPTPGCPASSHPKSWSLAPFLLQPQRESPPTLTEEQSGATAPGSPVATAGFSQARHSQGNKYRGNSRCIVVSMRNAVYSCITTY